MSLTLFGTQDLTCDFAREEFLSYAEKTFSDWTKRKGQVSFEIGVAQNGELPLSKTEDAYLIDVCGEKGKILGSNPRCALIGVYAFFTECGCRFLRPGKDGEFIKVQSLLDVCVKKTSKAKKEVRCVVIEGACAYENVLDTIDFSPKVGLNRYYFQFKNSAVFFRRWYEHKKNPCVEPEILTPEQIDEIFSLLVHEAKKRGLLVHTMGHGFTAYPFGLLSDGWEEQKEPLPSHLEPYFALRNGKRGLNRNRPFVTALCLSNPAVWEKLADYVVKYCQENPYVDVVDFALEDEINVSCECENCATERPADLMLRLLNYMDQRMTEANLPQLLLIPAYLATLWAPRKEKVNSLDRFIFGFFPITRTYHGPLPTEGIPKEEPYPYILNQLTRTSSVTKNLSFLKAWQKQVGGKWIIGEYHYMWDHYLDFGYQQIARVLWEDIRNQDQLQLEGMVMFQPQRCAVPTAMGYYTMGKTLWDPSVDFDQMSQDYFAHFYGDGWEDCYAYLQGLSDRYDMKIKDGGRKYRAVDCIPVLEECLVMVETFLSVHQEDFEKERIPMQAISWRDLRLHSQYVARYIKGLLTGLRGEEEEGMKQVEDLVLWLWQIEKEVQPRWDIFLHIGHLPVWYQRLMDQKHQEEKKEKIDLLSKNSAQEQEGFQA